MNYFIIDKSKREWIPPKPSDFYTNYSATVMGSGNNGFNLATAPAGLGETPVGMSSEVGMSNRGSANDQSANGPGNGLAGAVFWIIWISKLIFVIKFWFWGIKKIK